MWSFNCLLVQSVRHIRCLHLLLNLSLNTFGQTPLSLAIKCEEKVIYILCETGIKWPSFEDELLGQVLYLSITSHWNQVPNLSVGKKRKVCKQQTEDWDLDKIDFTTGQVATVKYTIYLPDYCLMALASHFTLGTWTKFTLGLVNLNLLTLLGTWVWMNCKF